jgi:hypothetical protein
MSREKKGFKIERSVSKRNILGGTQQAWMRQDWGPGGAQPAPLASLTWNLGLQFGSVQVDWSPAARYGGDRSL